MPAQAFGIPDKLDFGALSALESGSFLATFVLQKHLAERAGKHYDIRIGTPETGLLSWASRKGIPEKPGEKRLLIQQPLHEYSYKDFSGEIKEGYGKGKVETELGTVLINKVENNKLIFTRADLREPQRFALIHVPKYGKDKWLLINITPNKPHGIDKSYYKSISMAEAREIIKNLKPHSTVSAKLDGARSLIKLSDDLIEIYSQRTSTSGKPIIYTEKVFEGLPEVNIPDSLKDAVLVGELIGIRPDGTAIPSNELSGLLNSTLERAIKEKRKKDIEFIIFLFDIARKKGLDLNKLLPDEKIKLLYEIRDQLPDNIKKYLKVIDVAYDSREGEKLLNEIVKNMHSLTREGIIIATPEATYKAKVTPEFDVYIRAIFLGKGKYFNKGAGGFYYSLTPDGPIVGKVGTGFDDNMRKDMWLYPENYIGRKARVRATEMYPSGALRHPSFISLHEG